MAVGGYDGMAAIYEALKKTGGSTDAEKVMAALKGMKLMSPRGPIMIDPETRDVVQTVYIRKVEKTSGGLYNVEFDRFADRDLEALRGAFPAARSLPLLRLLATRNRGTAILEYLDVSRLQVQIEPCA